MFKRPQKPDPAPAPANHAKPDLLLRRLEWTVIRRLDGLLHGNYRTLFRGFGMDLAGLREYQSTDDVRHIDWNVTARLQVPHVRQYNEDREVTAWFLLDLSPSVDFGSQERKKRHILIESVAVLARILTRHGNRVGAMFYGGNVDNVIPASGGRDHVLHIMSSLEARPELPNAQPTNLRELLEAAHHVIKRRALVFVISDFISAPGWDRPLHHLARKHEVLALRLFDPLEQTLPDLGLFLMQDAETGEQLYVDTHDKGFRKRFMAAAEQREHDIRAAFAESGVDTLELSTDDDLADAMYRFADLRKKRSQLTGGGVPQKPGLQEKHA
ncbi:MAG: DUF58 domain-containing protein [Rhodospirillaceae bacterium]|nr:DUF58 domain-containing protein [Rhodospirillaceae bacterium]